MEMILAETFDYYLIAPKLIACILFIIGAFKIYNLNRSYLLNKFYLYGILGWALYMLMDSFIWIMADRSPLLNTIANVFRDAQMLGLMIMAFFIYNAQKIIQKSSTDLFNARFYIELVLISILAVILVISDGLDVYITGTDTLLESNQLPYSGETRTAPHITGYTVILSIIPVIMFLGSIIMQFYLAKTKIVEEDIKRRIRIRAYGLLFIFLGIFWFIFQNLIGWTGVVSVLPGYILWISAAVLMWLSTNDK